MESSIVDKMVAKENESAELSKRELEICELLIDGKTIEEVAIKLCISKATANNHRTRIRKKLLAKTNIDLGVKIFKYLNNNEEENEQKNEQKNEKDNS